MIKSMIFETIGGLGLFFLGMGLVSDGLKKAAGQKLRRLLESLTKHRVIAVLVGAVVTCLIQSSSATTVMTVGFVNAGLLTLKQALCVVLGANVGTTFTAWLVSGFGVLKITTYLLPAVGIGFLIQSVGRSQQMRNIGQIILGFGLLFLGISFMKDAFSPLRDNPAVRDALVWLGQNVVLAVFAGTVITVLLQSSSASIAMVQLLAFQGAFGTDWTLALRVAIPYILGDNIGTTITAQLAAMRTSRNARRTAMGHTIFNVIGVLYILPLVATGLFVHLVEWIAPFKLTQNTIMLHIAIAHTVFNVINTLVFLPVVRWLEIIVNKIIPVRMDELAQKPVMLERHLLKTPTIAMDQVGREIIRMSERACKAVEGAIDGLLQSDRRKLRGAMEAEDIIDQFQYEITAYLVELSRGELSSEISNELPVLLHTVNDLERIGDHAVNIVEIADRKIGQRIDFSEAAMTESDQLKSLIMGMFDHISLALKNNDTQAAQSALACEAKLNRMQLEFRRSHVCRMGDRFCSAETGIIFIDLVDNIEKIGDHLTNIAQSVIGGLQWDGVDDLNTPEVPGDR